MSKLPKRIQDRHDRLRRAAAEKIYELTHRAVVLDAEFQKSKPDVLKKIEASLDEHIFRPLFT